jgi:hypothetical protein
MSGFETAGEPTGRSECIREQEGNRDPAGELAEDATEPHRERREEQREGREQNDADQPGCRSIDIASIASAAIKTSGNAAVRSQCVGNAAKEDDRPDPHRRDCVIAASFIATRDRTGAGMSRNRRRNRPAYAGIRARSRRPDVGIAAATLVTATGPG